MRQTVTFRASVKQFRRVPTETGDWAMEEQTRWVGDAGLVDEAQALTWTLYSSPTPLERHRIEVLQHDLAGGLQGFLDLESGVELARAALVSRLTEQLWPEGRPDASGVELLRQNEALQKAWDADQSDLKAGWSTMNVMLERIFFLAAWRVLVVAPPAGWASLADRELDEPSFNAIWAAWVRAHDELRAGKAQSSAS